MNKEKSIKRRMIRLRKVQNPSAVDLKHIRTHRDARTDLWRLRKKTATRAKGEAKPVMEAEEKEEKPAKQKKEPELEVIDKELEELLDVDEDEETEGDDTDS